MIDTIHNYNDAGPLGLTLGLNAPVPFNQSPVGVGSAITKLDDTTFMINESGTYRVDYSLQTAALSLLGSAQVRVNGSPVGSSSALVSAGATLTGTTVFEGLAGDTIQIAVSGLGLGLASGESASITIMQLSDS